MSGWRMARDTVEVETPARRATSAMRERAVPARSRFEDCWSAMRALSSEDIGLGRRRAGLQEIEIAALIGLGDMLLEDDAVTAREVRRGLDPGGLAPGEFSIVDQHVQTAVGHVEHDLVAGLDQGEGAADMRFRRDMQHAGAVMGAAHARIGDPQDIADAFGQEFFRNRQRPPLRHARRADGSGAAQHQHAGLVDSEIGIVDPGRQFGMAVEHHRAAAMNEKVLARRRRLDDGAVGRQVAAQHRNGRHPGHRIVQRPDHVIVLDPGAAQRLRQRPAGDIDGLAVKPVGDARHQPQQSAGKKQVFHQIAARRKNVRQHRRLARGAIEAFQFDRKARTPRDRHQMDRGVGRAAERRIDMQRIVQRPLGQDVRRLEVLPDHFDDPLAAGRGHARMRGIHCRNAGCARQRQAQRIHDRGHGRCRAHGIAGAGRAGGNALDVHHFRFVHLAGAIVVPVLAGMGAGAHRRAAIPAVEHRAGGTDNDRQVHADGAHHHAGRGLVAAAEQHGAIHRMLAQQLFRLHRQEIAIEHGGRLDHHFAERQRRQFHRETSGAKNAALDGLRPLAQMRMARAEIAPGVDDGDHRPAHELVAAHPHLLHPLPMREGAHGVGGKPARAAKIGGLAAWSGAAAGHDGWAPRMDATNDIAFIKLSIPRKCCFAALFNENRPLLTVFMQPLSFALPASKTGRQNRLGATRGRTIWTADTF